MEGKREITYTLSILLLLVGCAFGQLGFGDITAIQPRVGYDVYDSTPPCSGRLFGERTRINSSDAMICYQVVGNHGAPNIVALNVAIEDPLAQSDLSFVAEQIIEDGTRPVSCFQYNMTLGTYKTFQLNYTTGDQFYVYCLDVQYGDVPDESGVDKLTFTASLSLFVVVVGFFVL